MACTIVSELREHGDIDQDRLAAQFADRCEPYRGYGAGAVVILHEIRAGLPWRQAAGTRDRIAHGYYEINLDVVWEIVSNDLPVLRNELNELLTRLG